MSDIFDEVDEILSDVDMGTEEVATAEAESNFNESELQDIMAEIENLEKEFETEPALAAEPIVVPVKKTNLQEEIEREIEMSKEVSAEKKEALVAPVAAQPKVLSFEKKSVPVSTKESSSEISFAANGQMNLNLEFKIGEESAKLSVDPVLGLVITMNGVELCINQEEGCKVSMKNGVNFTIPLTSSEPTSKKKTA